MSTSTTSPRPAPPGRPALRARYDRRHDELVAGAAAQFARAGYDQTTMQSLAASMGLATGALYHYFGGKEQLLAAICDQLMEPLLVHARALVGDATPASRRMVVRASRLAAAADRVAAQADGARPPLAGETALAQRAEPAEASDAGEPPAVSRLRALVRLWVAHVCDHRDHMLVFQQGRHVIESGERWAAVRDSRKAFERLAARVLADALGDGARGGGLPLLALLGMVNHTAQWYRPRGALTPEQIADGYVALVLGR